MLTQTIILSVTKYTVKPTVYMMQGDTGRVLNCAFSDFTVPDGATARLYIHRPNGTFYTETATVDGQVVTVDADQVLTTAGYVNCDLEIEADNETVQSFPFTVRVLATEAGSPQTTEKGVSVAELDARVTALENAPQGAAWGEITGNIAEQTDLQTALGEKLTVTEDGTKQGVFNGSLTYDPTNETVEMASGNVSVGVNGNGEAFFGGQVAQLKTTATDIVKVVNNEGTVTESPVATEAYVDEHGGGGSLYQHFIVMTYSTDVKIFVSIISSSSTAYTQETLVSYLNTLGANGWLKFYPATGAAKYGTSFLSVSGIFYNSGNLSIGAFDASANSGFRTITPGAWTIVDTVTAL